MQRKSLNQKLFVRAASVAGSAAVERKYMLFDIYTISTIYEMNTNEAKKVESCNAYNKSHTIKTYNKGGK